MSSLSKKEYLSLKMPTEEAPLSDQQRIVLALKTLGYEPVTIPLPVLRQLYPLCRNAEFDITVTLVHRDADWVVTHVEAGDQRQHHYGLAVDYGSTGIVASQCPIMVVSGNTTMIHFLLGLNAWTVFTSPYAPVTTDPGFLWGHELDLDFEGLLYFIPAASNYVGGDIVSGLLALELHRKEETSLFFDIGTNGELVIGNSQWLIAGAGAAGPALEGYISQFGMRAAPGAIDSVKINGGKLTYSTIEGKKAVGICGSGIIDLLAQMRLNGWINIAGELNPEASDRIVYLSEENQYAAVYSLPEESASAQALYFSQTDILQYLDTKAAAFTMIDSLMSSAGISEADLSHCYLSGAFPAHSDLEAAITLGIFPDLPREKYSVLKNSSLDGARKVLLDHGQLEQLQKILDMIYCVQFASIPDFLIQMQAAKFIPHTESDRFPTVQEILRKLQS